VAEPPLPAALLLQREFKEVLLATLFTDPTLVALFVLGPVDLGAAVRAVFEFLAKV
jgi:hypothetical protein